MKPDWLPHDGANRWIEPLLTIPVVVGGIYVMWSVITRHFFPAPFLYSSGDTWMDWFNPALYSHNAEAYEVYNALYPPLSFVLLKFTTLPHCYPSADPWSTRDCDWLARIILHAWFVLNIYLISKSYLLIDRGTAIWRSIITVAGLPALHGFERANLIIATTSFYVLAHGPILRSSRVRWIMTALSINMKIYLLPTLFVYLLKRRWRWFEGATLATISVWVVTWMIYGAGTPMQVYANLNTWSSIFDTPAKWVDVWYNATYYQLLGVLNSTTFPILELLGSTYVETGASLLVRLNQMIQVLLIVAMAGTWLRPEVVPMRRLVNLGALFAITLSEPGAYGLPLLFFLTLTEKWEGLGRKMAIIICYISAIPGELYLNPIGPITQAGFLNRTTIIFDFWLTYGIFLRPGLIMLIPIGLSCATIAAVWQDIRQQGWKRRQRFRRDLPLMLGGGRQPDDAHA